MKTLIFCAILLGCSTTLVANHLTIANGGTLSIANRPVSISQNSSNQEFVALGTEPFWNVTVSKKNGIVYSSPETRKLTFPYVAPLTASGRPADLLRVYRFKDKANSMLIIKKVNSCSDGMSDTVYPYSATLILGNKVLEGCAKTK